MTISRTTLARERGVTHGPITRLISPGGIGERLKPFIFLDYFSAEITPGFGFPMHPHSGIATLTWQPGCDVQYEDTTGQNGTLKAGGLEWMNAGGGARHQGRLMGTGRATGFQLWVPMPPGVEDGTPVGQYVPPDQVPKIGVEGGEVLVLLGSIQGADAAASSPVVSHQDMSYAVLSLDNGCAWRYELPATHNVAWAFVFEGQAEVQGTLTGHELVVFDGEGALAFTAPRGRVRVLFGTAKRHDHALVLGPSSVHTNARSLEDAQRRMHTLGVQLMQAGRLE